MNGGLAIHGAVFVLLLAFSGFCSGSETVFFSLDALRVRRIGQAYPVLAPRLHALLARPTRLLPDHAEKISIAAMTVILLIFGEFGPKQIAMKYATALAPRFVVPMPAAVARMTPRVDLKGGIRIGGVRCRDIMIPRDRMVTVETSASVAELLDLARRRELSRFPAWDPRARKFAGAVTGVVTLTDVLNVIVGPDAPAAAPESGAAK